MAEHPVPAPRRPPQLCHGGYSETLLGPVKADVLAELEAALADHPAGAPMFAPQRALLAAKLARYRILNAWLEERYGGRPVSRKGQVLKPVKLLLQLEQSIERTWAEMGLTPLSASKLGVNVARGKSLVERLAEARAREAGR